METRKLLAVLLLAGLFVATSAAPAAAATDDSEPIDFEEPEAQDAEDHCLVYVRIGDIEVCVGQPTAGTS